MNQHIQTFGGAVKNAKGSGRRIQVGSAHSGFHQPHGYDGAELKGGALKSVALAMQHSHGGRAAQAKVINGGSTPARKAK